MILATRAQEAHKEFSQTFVLLWLLWLTIPETFRRNVRIALNVHIPGQQF